MRHARILVASVLLALSWGLMGTTCSQNVQLDPAGPYRGDVALYRIDKEIIDTDAYFDELEEWSTRNAAYVAAHQNIANFVASMRERRSQWIAQALAARDVFARTRTIGDWNTLTGKLDILRGVLAEARLLLLVGSPPEVAPTPTVQPSTPVES